MTRCLRSRANRSRNVLVGLTAALALACGEPEPPAIEWHSYASDPASSKYSPADQIDASNVSRLGVAWKWTSADVRWKKRFEAAQSAAGVPRAQRQKINISEFQGTPLMVDGVVYGVTPVGILYALDAASGREIWLHDPKVYARARPGSYDFWYPKHRGVTYWSDGDDERIFVPTYDAQLIAVDARTGKPVPSFGDAGRVDLLDGVRRDDVQRYTDLFQTSPAALYHDTLIVGNSVDDRPPGPTGVPGDIRAYDARTGALRWTFHTVPTEGEFGAETWEDESWREGGAANAWGPITVDTELGYVYVTTSTPTNDFYGGHRLGDNLFGETLLCLDAETGKRIWHFQMIHHGLWDYDPGAAANLVDVTVDGRAVKAVVQVTKQGFAYTFDRVTGEPIWPIEERPVPASDVPGERASPTQPFPTKPPPFERQGITKDDLVDFTPELHAKALSVFEKLRTGPLFTPPSLRGTIVLPGPNGGSNWRGAGVDPESGMLYVPSITQPISVAVRPGNPKRESWRFTAGGTMPLVLLGKPGKPDSIPIVKPPYSRITAMDMNQGTIVWQVANGDGPRNSPVLAPLKLPRLGSGAHTCVLVTRTLVFAGGGATFFSGTAGEPILTAYDKSSGEVVHQLKLPARVNACPMTYVHAGVQFLVVAVAEPRKPPMLLALALPQAPQPAPAR